MTVFRYGSLCRIIFTIDFPQAAIPPIRVSQSRSKTGGQYRKDPLEVLFFAESAVGNGEDRHKTI